MLRVFPGIQLGQMTVLCDDIQTRVLRPNGSNAVQWLECSPMARMWNQARASRLQEKQSFRVRAARHPRGLAPSNHTFTRPSKEPSSRNVSLEKELMVGVVTRAGLAKRYFT